MKSTSPYYVMYLLCLCLLLLPDISTADTVILNSGRKIEGTSIEQKDGYIYYRRDGKKFRIKEDLVDSVEVYEDESAEEETEYEQPKSKTLSKSSGSSSSSGGFGAKLYTGNINLLYGTKNLEENDWTPLEKQDEYGIECDFRGTEWPVNLALAYYTSSEEVEEEVLIFIPGLGFFSGMLTTEGKTSEICFGLKKIFDAPSGNDNFQFKPFIGGGLCSVKGELKTEISALGSSESESESDSSIGFWLNGGFYLQISNMLNIGIMGRYSDAKVTLYEVGGEAGGTHILGFIGYHF